MPRLRTAGLPAPFLLAALVSTGCFLSADDKAKTDLITGLWKQPLAMHVTSSVHTENTGSVGGRIPYLDGYELDSTSCRPDFFKSDTAYDHYGTWEFSGGSAYENEYYYDATSPRPQPCHGCDTTKVFAHKSRTGEYELRNDTLRLILNRIGDKTAFELRFIEINDSRDTMRIIRQDLVYADGPCLIKKQYVELLVRP